MDISAINGPGTTPPSRDASLGLAEDFDSFLKLLTTQLTSQDALEPMDANEFTAQLVQFSEVEQSIRTNEALEQLVALSRGDQFARGAAYIGSDVTADTATISVGAEGVGQGFYSLMAEASHVTVRVRNAAGEIVHEGTGEGTVGRHTIPWNGLDREGRRVDPGVYSVEVDARDVDGGPVAVETSLRGRVDGVEIGRGGRLMLSVDGVLVASDSLVALHAEPAPTAP